MRRTAGALVPLEIAILDSLVYMQSAGVGEAHGYAIAHAVEVNSDARRLTGYGSLYKALDRLERSGLLESRWEAPDDAAAERRPRRRYYRTTPAGAAALTESAMTARAAPASGHPRRGEVAT